VCWGKGGRPDNGLDVGRLAIRAVNCWPEADLHVKGGKRDSHRRA